MNSILQRWSRVVSSPRGAKWVLIVWIAVIAILSGAAPGAKQYAVSSGEGSVRNDTPSAEAQAILNEQFPTRDGLAALLVFHSRIAITTEERAVIAKISEWLSSVDKPEHIAGAVPFHQLPAVAQDKLFSKDGTTVMLNVTLQKDLDSDAVYDTLKQIRTYVEQSGIGTMQFEITGPAGISADTITLFKNADLVLMFATIGLILVILIIIYRSPLLAVIPLIIAGLVYQVADRLLGLAAKNGWFTVDKQALSIMMILLFAVLTDYCLFVFSRFRDELKKIGSKHGAMEVTMTRTAEPIMFSGGTVLIAMATLFAAVFKPYHNFAPVFTVAMGVIVLAGVTLIPAVYTIAGRRAFWPFIPKLEDMAVKAGGFWSKTGEFVTRKPALTMIVLLAALLASALNVGSMTYSFNLMKSFPADISSRQGFQILEDRYPHGQLAPLTVVLKSRAEIVPDSAFADKLAVLTDSLKKQEGVDGVTPDLASTSMPGADVRTADSDSPLMPDNLLSAQKHDLKLQLTLKDNPYDQSALDAVSLLRDNSGKLLRDSGFDPSQYSLHYAGQTAEQLDVRNMNQADTVMTFSLIAVLITVMLAFQTRSILMAVMMIATILLSYAATLGVGWAIFHGILGYDAISYRLPVYTFVFLVALGVDYNIMLVSRIKEESLKHNWKTAVSRGVSLTGGVISSAGIILAATFCVLITQPLQELFLFGMTMAFGLLIDTFLVRGMLLPAVMTMTGNRR